MNALFIQPGRLEGSLTAPPSKSIAHRAILCAALAGDFSLASIPEREMSKDIIATSKAIRDLLADEKQIFCNESGSTLRFMIPIAAALGKEVTFTGSGRLGQRPLYEYRTILASKGITLKYPDEGSLPLSISGKMNAGEFFVPGDVSSQYVTGLLLALPLLDGNSKIVITSPLESAAYVDMTIRVMQHFGIRVERLVNGYFVPGNQKFLKTPCSIEGDYSQAAFWMVANYLGSNVRINGLETASVQGDKQIINILKEFEDLKESNENTPRENAKKYWSDIVGRKEDKTVIEIDASQIPDLIPVVAVAAANTDAITRIVNAKRLRYKESDRLNTTAQLITQIGGWVVETPDGLIIYGGRDLAGGTVDSAGDHRIAMAAAVAALNTKKGIVIKGYTCIDKSYPAFFDEFKRLGGICDELDVG